jgi:hypothetical protein
VKCVLRKFLYLNFYICIVYRGDKIIKMEYYWNSDKNDLFLDSNDHLGRTTKLIDALELMIDDDKYKDFETKIRKKIYIDDIGNSRYFSINTLTSYMNLHPDMIKYEFDANNKLTRIKVKPYSLFTLKANSKVRQCDMSTYITELLKLFTHNGIEVIMSNQEKCKGVEGSAEAKAVTALPVEGDTPVAAGGSKSRRRHRRKPARKTRRGRGRNRNRKSKTKTDHRIRHSRVRKHKKYTSRRR